MSTALSYLFGTQQGRIQPDDHDVDALDTSPAALITGVSEPFALADLDTFEIEVDGGTAQQVQFMTADFADITMATAAEIVAVLNAALTGVTADDQGGAVRLISDTIGASSSLHVVDGTSLPALSFPDVQVNGFDGSWSFVLGHDDPGVSDVFQSGDEIFIGQTAAINTDERLRLVGEVRWPTTAPTPAGYAWEIVLDVDGDEYVIQDPNQEYTLSQPIERTSLNDALQNMTGLGGTPAVSIGLRLADIGGGAGTDVTYEIPAVYIDAVQLDEDIDDLTLGQRTPAPGTIGWSLDFPELELTVIDTTASPVDTTATVITVDVNAAGPVTVYDGGAGGFQAPFTGSVSAGVGPAGRDTAWVIDWTGASFYPFSSEDVVDVRVQSDTVATGSAIDETYSFTMADTTQPMLVQAQARSQKVTRLTFNEPMEQETLEVAGNYDFQIMSAPAVSIVAVSAEAISTTEVDVTVDIEMTQGAEYLVTVANVEDLQGNVIDPANDEATFIGFFCPRPAGRDFEFWKFMPTINRREDVSRDLRNWSLIQQDIIDLLLCDIDRWTEIFDIDIAEEDFVDAILAHLGNPFDFPDLSLVDKRRLGRILVDIYKQKGTEPGIVNAILFFTGISVTLDIINDRDFWQIGVDLLGDTTYLAPGVGDPLWYSFYIVSPVVLTPDQRARILGIATYMKAAHEHIIDIIEPGGAGAPVSFWILGVSELGADTILSA